MSASAAEISIKPPAGYPEYTPPPKQERIADKDGLVPFVRTEKPFVDKLGRTRVIVDFMDSAKDRFLDAARPAIEKFDPKRDRHNPQTLLLLDAKSKQYGIQALYRSNERNEQERTDITTWVGASLVAYLDAEQIHALRKDNDVRLLTADREVTYSTQSLWEPDWNPSEAEWTELTDWGWMAVQGKSVLPGSNRIVWILDSGVAHHTELSSVISRTSVGGQQVVGCYAHATHIAGIIGAESDNAQGRRGIYAGVQMRSIGVGSSIDCSPPNTALFIGPTAWGVNLGLDEVYSASITVFFYNASPKPNVINISANGLATGFVPNTTVLNTTQSKIALAATPHYPFPSLWYVYYPGNVVVQSAGNNNQSACPWAYQGDPNNSVAKVDDGVLVVGAIGSDGDHVASFSNSYPSGVMASSGGSNHGPCVDIWAPGNAIYSTWGRGGLETSTTTTYSGGQTAVCTFPNVCTGSEAAAMGWAWGSGTSMAAPHVAAAAAYYIDLLNLSTPSQVESVLRATALWLPISGLNIVQLQ